MASYHKEELNKILKEFGLSNNATAQPFGEGHINQTYKVCDGDRTYILQKVNTAIFKDFEGVMQNIQRVCDHIKAKGAPTMEVIAYKKPWRLYTYVLNSYSIYVLDNPDIAYKGAKAFAQFQNNLADLPEPRLNETLPKFHDLRDRLRLLDEAIAKDAVNRVDECADLLKFVDDRRHYADDLLDLLDGGQIPERITHNDTKINNVMLDKDTDDVIAIVDLDTVMPGCALYDFGDMVRSATASAEEDETDLTKVFSKANYFEALVRGYASEAKFLNQTEIDNLAFSGVYITFVIFVRFLTDYISGDVYFQTNYPKHNLDRARNQAKMVTSIEDQLDDYKNIVRQVFKN